MTINLKKFEAGVKYACEAFKGVPYSTAVRELKQNVDASIDFGAFDDFDRGIRAVLVAVRGSLSPEEQSAQEAFDDTYDEAARNAAAVAWR